MRLYNSWLWGPAGYTTSDCETDLPVYAEDQRSVEGTSRLHRSSCSDPSTSSNQAYIEMFKSQDNNIKMDKGSLTPL